METAFTTRGDADAIERFNKAIEDLMSLGFNDPERLKSEPSFERMFTDPETAPRLQNAIEQMQAPAEPEGNADDASAADTSEAEGSP